MTTEGERRALAEWLCVVAGRFNQRGWCLGTSGNFSAVLHRDPLEMLITGSGLNKADLTVDDFVAVDRDAGLVAGERGKPSAEALLHAVVAERTGAASVLHTHSVAGTLVGEHYRSSGGVSIGGYEMLKGLRDIRTHETTILLPVLDNSQDMPQLANAVRSLLDSQRDVPGFLIAGHGLYAWGDTLDEAERHVEIFEFLLECVARRTRFTTLPGELEKGESWPR